MPEFPKFTAEDYEQSRRVGCSDDSCNINYIINRPGVSTSGGGGGSGDGCCDCPPGPQGPPGPAGPRGDSGSTGCSNVYAGPLVSSSTTGIDEQAFQDLLGSKGYIVRLSVVGGNYSVAEIDADVVTYPNGDISFLNINGTIGSGQISNEDTFYPIAYQTVGPTGISYYNHTPSFQQFLEMCGLRDAASKDPSYSTPAELYTVGYRNDIPSLLNCVNAQVPNNRPYTFISKEGAAMGGVNGPYYPTQFKNTVSGIVSGTIRSDTYSSDNPATVSNLGHEIIKSDGSIGVAYDCIDCIQGPPDANILSTISGLTSCDVFVDTENGVMYTRDDQDWPSGSPRFNQNGIPLRRQPSFPEIPPPPAVRNPPVDNTFFARITGSTGVGATPPFFKWTYQFEQVFPNTSNGFTTTTSGITGTAINGSEILNDIEGIGDGIFDNFPAGSFEMLPIRTGVVVLMQKNKNPETYAFSIPNAYKARCEA
jgi:hypothetical protein